MKGVDDSEWSKRMAIIFILYLLERALMRRWSGEYSLLETSTWRDSGENRLKRKDQETGIILLGVNKKQHDNRMRSYMILLGVI